MAGKRTIISERFHLDRVGQDPGQYEALLPSEYISEHAGRYLGRKTYYMENRLEYTDFKYAVAAGYQKQHPCGTRYGDVPKEIKSIKLIQLFLTKIHKKYSFEFKDSSGAAHYKPNSKYQRII